MSVSTVEGSAGTAAMLRHPCIPGVADITAEYIASRFSLPLAQAEVEYRRFIAIVFGGDR